MQAGYELDSLIAEKVMDSVNLPYSTDIQSAWKVAEKLRPKWVVSHIKEPVDSP